MKKIYRSPRDFEGLMVLFTTKKRAGCAWVGEIEYGGVELVPLFPTSSVIKQQSGQFWVQCLKTSIGHRSLDRQILLKR